MMCFEMTKEMIQFAWEDLNILGKIFVMPFLTLGFIFAGVFIFFFEAMMYPFTKRY